MQTRIQTLATVALCFVTMVVIATPFVSSLWPSDRANAERPRVTMPKLNPLEFVFVEEPNSLENWPTQILFIRKANGTVDVWRVPRKDGLFQLPDIHWWQRGPTCKRFAPDFSAGRIGCRDETMGGWGKENYEWDLEGKNITGNVDNLERAAGQEVSGEYIFGLGK